MVLSLTACSSKPDSNNRDDAAAEPAAAASDDNCAANDNAAVEVADAAPSESDNAAAEVADAAPSESEDAAALANNAATLPTLNATPAGQEHSHFNGLWITASSIGTLYYFDNGKVTSYTCDNYDPVHPDLHYKVAYTGTYTVRPLAPSEGAGYKAVLDTGNEYWALESTPGMLQCSWYDNSGALQVSFSDSLAPVTNFTVDDLILDDAPSQSGASSGDAPSQSGASSGDAQSLKAAYAPIVHTYESKYGPLEFTTINDYDYYTGVFLVRLIDFNQDGSDDLLIGYSTRVEGLQEFITAPKFDVWTMWNGNPVQAYEGAIVHHGDIGSHCAYTNLDGQWFLISGSTGFATDLHLMVLHNAEFQDFNTLFDDGLGTCRINNRDTTPEEWNETYRRVDQNSVKYQGVITDSGQETESSLRYDLQQGYASLGM